MKCKNQANVTKITVRNNTLKHAEKIIIILKLKLLTLHNGGNDQKGRFGMRKEEIYEKRFINRPS